MKILSDGGILTDIIIIPGVGRTDGATLRAHAMTATGVVCAATWAVAAFGAAPRPLVLHVAGIGVGARSTEADVLKGLGKGCFAAAEPHAGGHYFTDPQQSLTLHIVVGVDDAIEAIEVREGLHVPPTCAGSPMTSRLAEGPEVEHGLRLGMSEAQIRRVLGAPDETHAAGGQTTLVFRAQAEQDARVSLFYEASFQFERGRLVAIAISDGE